MMFVRKAGWPILIVIYAVLVYLTYKYQMSEGLFFLTIPWSCVVAIFGMLIIHVSTIGMDDYMLMGGVVNVLLLSGYRIRRYLVASNQL